MTENELDELDELNERLAGRLDFVVDPGKLMTEDELDELRGALLYAADPDEQERLALEIGRLNFMVYSLRHFAEKPDIPDFPDFPDMDPVQAATLNRMASRLQDIIRLRIFLAFPDDAFLAVLEEYAEAALHRAAALERHNHLAKLYNKDATFINWQKWSIPEQLPGTVFEDGPAAVAASYERAKAFLAEEVSSGAPDAYGGTVPRQALVREHEMIDVDAEGRVFKVKASNDTK